MKVDLALEKSMTSKSYHIVINDRFYIKITKEAFVNLLKELKLKSVENDECEYYDKGNLKTENKLIRR